MGRERLNQCTFGILMNFVNTGTGSCFEGSRTAAMHESARDRELGQSVRILWLLIYRITFCFFCERLSFLFGPFQVARQKAEKKDKGTMIKGFFLFMFSYTFEVSLQT